MNREGSGSLTGVTVIVRIVVLLLIAFSVPRCIHWWFNEAGFGAKVGRKRFKLGVENISPEFLRELYATCGKRCRVGLITNGTGKDQSGNRTIDILLHKGLHLSAIFMPEPGAVAASRKKVTRTVDPITQLPIVYLADNSFDAAIIKNLDVIFFDVQDVGVQHSRYLSMLLAGMQVAAQQSKKFVVLDRPNPLGACMEGALGDVAQTASLVVPVRHGMTVGEVARYLNTQVMQKPVSLVVVPMKRYHRHALTQEQEIAALGLHNHQLHGYSFLRALHEVMPFDVGAETDKAFKCIALPCALGFPKHKWYELQMVLNNLGIDSAFYQYVHTATKQPYSGLQVAVKDVQNFSSFKALIDILAFFKQSGVPLTFSGQFDTAIGSTQIRDFFEGRIERDMVEKTVNNDLQGFFKRATSSFMYTPLPKLVTV